jgi:hypothetical protein
MNQLFDDQKNQFNEPVNNQVSPQDYLPSKKMMSTIIGIIIIIIIIIFRNSIIGLFKKIGDIQLRQPGGIPTSVVTQGKTSVSFNINKDTDADGILDWQEALLGTDSEVYTTLEEVPIEMRQIVNDSMNILTTSDQLALAIYERSRANPVGDSYEQNLQAAAAKEILDLADSIDQQLTTYILEDLNIILDGTTDQDYAKYKQDITTYFKKINLPSLVATTYPNFLKGEQTRSEQITFGNLVNELIKIPVPFEYANNHLELLNALAHTYDVFVQSDRLSDDSETMRLTLLFVLQKNINLVDQKMSDFSIMLNIPL